LSAAGFHGPEIDRALDDLERVGLVEDRRFARELVRDQAARRLAGDRAIRSALREKGVASSVADEALAASGDERERARALAGRRAARLAGLAPDAAYRRLLGVLVRRGYGAAMAAEACREALAEVFGDDAVRDDSS
jgi:regulatory protein